MREHAICMSRTPPATPHCPPLPPPQSPPPTATRRCSPPRAGRAHVPITRMLRCSLLLRGLKLLLPLDEVDDALDHLVDQLHLVLAHAVDVRHVTDAVVRRL